MVICLKKLIYLKLYLTKLLLYIYETFVTSTMATCLIPIENEKKLGDAKYTSKSIAKTDTVVNTTTTAMINFTFTSTIHHYIYTLYQLKEHTLKIVTP